MTVWSVTFITQLTTLSNSQSALSKKKKKKKEKKFLMPPKEGLFLFCQITSLKIGLCFQYFEWTTLGSWPIYNDRLIIWDLWRSDYWVSNECCLWSGNWTPLWSTSSVMVVSSSLAIDEWLVCLFDGIPVYT
jgi:hypothetical protein